MNRIFPAAVLIPALLTTLASASASAPASGSLPASADDAVWALLRPGTGEEMRCGASLEKRIREGLRRGELSGEAQAAWEAAFRGDYDETLETEHFRIGYWTSGPDQITGWPDPAYRDSLAVYLETAYDAFASDPRFSLRPPRGSQIAAEDGRPLILVSVQEIPGAFGLAHGWHTDPPGECPEGAWGSISIDIGFGGRPLYEEARLTTAHEVMHMFQYTVNHHQSSFVQESVATWSENVVWPGQGRVHWATWQMWAPHLAVWNTNPWQRAYGAAVFWTFLDAYLEPRAGRSLPVVIVDEGCDPSVSWFDVLASECELRGTDLDSALHTFNVWNFYVGGFADASHHPQAADLQDIRIHDEVNRYPVADQAIPAVFDAEWGGSHHVLFRGPATRRALHLRIDGAPETAGRRRATLIASSGLRRHVEYGPAFADDNGDLEFRVPDWSTFDQLHLVVTNSAFPDGLPSAVLPYRYSVAEQGESVVGVRWASIGEDSALRIAPDPMAAGATVRFLVGRGEVPTVVTVVDIHGRKIAEIARGHLEPGLHNRQWNGRAADGTRVAGGTYYVVVQNGASRAVEAVTVIR